MALNETLTITSPVKLGTTDVARIWGTGAPQGSQSPQSDALKGSIYIRTDATDDQSPLYVKVDENNSDDDWVAVFVDKDGAAKQLSAALTMATDNKVYFRDTGIYIYSPGDTEMQLVADGQTIISGGSGLRLLDTARVYKEVAIGPHQFDVSESGSITLGTMRHTGESYPAIKYAGAGDLTARADMFKVPTDAASSGSILVTALWSSCTDGDAAVWRVGYDYIANGEPFGTCSGSIILAGSNSSGSFLTSSSVGNLPSFTQDDYVAIRVQHVGTSGSDDSGSTTDLAALTLRYMVDRLGEKT